MPIRLTRSRLCSRRRLPRDVRCSSSVCATTCFGRARQRARNQVAGWFYDRGWKPFRFQQQGWQAALRGQGGSKTTSACKNWTADNRAKRWPHCEGYVDINDGPRGVLPITRTNKKTAAVRTIACRKSLEQITIATRETRSDSSCGIERPARRPGSSVTTRRALAPVVT